jgi:trehalose 6-phosphate synthase/phosphatase
MAASGDDRPAPVVLSSREEIDATVAQMCSAERLLLLLDYDGTLVPFARSPDLGAPDRELRDLLSALAARPGVSVHIVSGRKRATLERWLGDLAVGLHAEHGFASRMARGEPWTQMEGISDTWKAGARRLLDSATVMTPGSLVEEKAVSLAWHYRMADPELGAERAAEVWRRLEDRLQGEPVELLRGERVIEIRPRGVSKGSVVERLLATTPLPLPTIAAMGDDTTDEDLFRALPAGSITISVGFRPSAARFRVPRPRAARALLSSVAGLA